MSEKQAKTQRANTNQVVAKITIIAHANGSITVEGIPMNPLLTINIVNSALKIMTAKFSELNNVKPDGRRLN